MPEAVRLFLPCHLNQKPSLDGIYRAWFGRVYRWVRMMGAREVDSNDLVQDVFLVVHRRLASFDGQSLSGWLFRITQRRVRDYQRSFWIKRSRLDVPSVVDLLPAHARPDQEAEAREEALCVSTLLASLKPEQSLTFTLFEIEGLAGRKIAQLQNIPLNTVWARIHRTRKFLQEEAAREPRASVPAD